MTTHGKRQRRSYSCGPCKLLKIKCDLRLPCSACQKFKRESKCREAPPDPPSAEEMVVIQERKQRMSKRRSNSRSGLEHLQMESLPFGYSEPLLSHSSTHPPQYSYPMAPSIINHHQLPLVPMNNIRELFTPTSATPTSIPLAVSPYEPSLNIEQTSFKNISTTPILQDPNPLQLLNQFLKSKNLPIISLESEPSIEGPLAANIRTFTEKKFTILLDDVNLLKKIFPSDELLCRLFLGHFKTFKEDLLELSDYTSMMKIALRFNQLLANTKEDSTIDIGQFQFRSISIILCIISSGLLVLPKLKVNEELTNTELINSWLLFSKRVREGSKHTETLLGMVYLIAWYFQMNNYYHLTHMLMEDHFEFNSLLSTLLFNKTYRHYIVNENLDVNNLSPEHLKEYKLCLKFWLRMRIIELDVLYFQYKSSLLQSNNTLTKSVIPDHQTLELVFGHDMEGLKDDILKCLYKISLGYFNNFSNRNRINVNPLSQFQGEVEDDNTPSFRELIMKYLSLYRYTYELFAPSLREFEHQMAQLDGQDLEINDMTILLYYRNQIVLMVFVKWLGFVRMESFYFASLRYTSYLTSMMTMFNHYKVLDKLLETRSNGRDNLMNQLLSSRSSHPLQFVIHSIVLQILFLITMKNFLIRAEKNQRSFVPGNTLEEQDDYYYYDYDNDEDDIHVINLKKYFTIIHDNFMEFYGKFERDYRKTFLKMVPLFKDTFELVNELIVFYNSKMSFEQQWEVSEFFQRMSVHLSSVSLNLLVDLYFGCKSTLFLYLGKLWSLFKFLKTTTKSDDLKITSTKSLTDEVIFSYTDKFIGFEVTNEVVEDYLRTVVDPALENS